MTLLAAEPLATAGLLGRRRRLPLPIDGVRAVCDEEIRYSLRKVSANLSNKEHAPLSGYKPSESRVYLALLPTPHHRAPKMGQLASLASECARFSRQIRQKPAFHDNNVRVQVTHSWRTVAAKGADGLLDWH
ncbi:MAG: hypothetical protein F2646_02405 [Actinobacteria bacterium]|nr:hypothetical protein [Actinomycetota bacterium]